MVTLKKIGKCLLTKQKFITFWLITFVCILFSVPDCSKAADVAFIVDSSESIGKTNWERTKRFLKRIVSKLDIGPTTTHIAIISYSTNPEIVLRFNSLSGRKMNVNEVVKVLDGLPWQRGFTNIDKALEQAAQEVFTSAAGMRSNVTKVDVVFIVALLVFLLWSFIKLLKGSRNNTLLYLKFGRRGGLMVSALDSGASGPGSSPGRGHCVVFLGKTLHSHSASLHPGV